MNNNLVTIVCLVYVIVYLVLRIYQKPNFEFFYAVQGGSRNIEEFSTGSSDNGNDGATTSEDKLIADIKKALTESEEKFKDQQQKQINQNKLINELKEFVNQARDELVIHRNTEKQEMSNIHSQINNGDSLSQVMSGTSTIANSVGKFGDSGSKSASGNDYNLNFNLDDE
tara:strand:+ start:122 stop:631 length:510 start_codon:yes stop_codon:yes gene_type:complete